MNVSYRMDFAHCVRPSFRCNLNYQNRWRIYAFRCSGSDGRPGPWPGAGAVTRSGAMAESIRYETFVISARDSNHKYTQRQGVNCRTFYANVHWPPGPGSGSCDALSVPMTRTLLRLGSFRGTSVNSISKFKDCQTCISKVGSAYKCNICNILTCAYLAYKLHISAYIFTAYFFAYLTNTVYIIAYFLFSFILLA